MSDTIKALEEQARLADALAERLYAEYTAAETAYGRAEAKLAKAVLAEANKGEGNG